MEASEISMPSGTPFVIFSNGVASFLTLLGIAIITGCGVGGALDFACELITALCGKAKADEIAESVVHHVYG